MCCFPTQMVLAAAAAASPQVEEALRTTIIEVTALGTAAMPSRALSCPPLPLGTKQVSFLSCANNSNGAARRSGTTAVATRVQRQQGRQGRVSRSLSGIDVCSSTSPADSRIHGGTGSYVWGNPCRAVALHCFAAFLLGVAKVSFLVDCVLKHFSKHPPSYPTATADGHIPKSTNRQ